MDSFLTERRTCDVILAILNSNGQGITIRQIARNIDTESNLVSGKIAKLESLGIITSKIQGRNKYVYLTEKGTKVSNGLLSICNA